MENKCKHEDIVVVHYANEETDMYISCKVRCANCGTELFDAKKNSVEVAYKYIEENKQYISSLYDLTCDNLNERFDIKDRYEGVWEYSK